MKNFTPFAFQVPLAAGGIALMAFNYLQFAVPHGKGLIRLSDIAWETLNAEQLALYLPLIVIMLVFSLINVGSIAYFLRVLNGWRSNRTEYDKFMSSPPTANIGILVPIASLSMAANVVLAPLAFFIPQLSSNMQDLMMPALVFYGFLLFALVRLELKLLRTWFSQPLDTSKLNFVWLIDAFAFGLVNLTGSGIAALSRDETISSVAAYASYFALAVGILLFAVKFSALIYFQAKAARFPQSPVLPSYFLIVPITCLFGLSLHRMALYTGAHYQVNVEGMSFMLINLSYLVTIGWGVFTVYLLRNYFRDYFYKSEFSPTMWAIV
ncbi:MAG TPA: hypothetical protein VIX18_05955 [Nitrospirota bacterium]